LYSILALRKDTFSLDVDFDYLLNSFSVKSIILVGIENQQFQGTIISMVFDLQCIF